MTRDQLIKTMARAIYDAECPTGRLWTDRADGTRGAYITLATAALTALEAAWMRVVPVEPTHKMIVAGIEAYSHGGPLSPVYEAMLAAAQEDSTSE